MPSETASLMRADNATGAIVLTVLILLLRPVMGLRKRLSGATRHAESVRPVTKSSNRSGSVYLGDPMLLVRRDLGGRCDLNRLKLSTIRR